MSFGACLADRTVVAEGPKANREIPNHGPSQWWPEQLCVGPAAVLGDTPVASRRPTRNSHRHDLILSQLLTICKRCGIKLLRGISKLGLENRR